MDKRTQGWPPGHPLFQPPNRPLIAAQAAWALAAVADGPVRTGARAVFYAAFATWAALEVTDGVNAVRRAYGAIGLAYVGARLGAAYARR